MNCIDPKKPEIITNLQRYFDEIAISSDFTILYGLT